MDDDAPRYIVSHAGEEVSILDTCNAHRQVWVQITRRAGCTTQALVQRARVRANLMNADERRWEEEGA